MNNFHRDRILDFFCKYAPKAPIKECMEIATGFEAYEEGEYRAKEALALLAEVIGFDTNGGFEEIARKYKDDKAILWALDQVSYCYAWVVCGPMPDGINRLKIQVEDDINNKKKALNVSTSYLREFEQAQQEKG